jgi:hypothetical protein
MTRITFGLISGLAFGVISAVILLPKKFDSNGAKVKACLAAFVDRFLIGFVVPNLELGLPPVMGGGLIGLGLSLPLLLILRDYIPILGLGAVGGALIGVICKIIMSLP